MFINHTHATFLLQSINASDAQIAQLDENSAFAIDMAFMELFDTPDIMFAHKMRVFDMLMDTDIPYNDIENISERIIHDIKRRTLHVTPVEGGFNMSLTYFEPFAKLEEMFYAGSDKYLSTPITSDDDDIVYPKMFINNDFIAIV